MPTVRKDMISAPQGFEHVGHVGYDPETGFTGFGDDAGVGLFLGKHSPPKFSRKGLKGFADLERFQEHLENGDLASAATIVYNPKGLSDWATFIEEQLAAAIKRNSGELGKVRRTRSNLERWNPLFVIRFSFNAGLFLSLRAR
jgi:hypothetical protein